MSVPRSDAAFCRALVTWECKLVFLPDDEVEYPEESEELRRDPTYDPDMNTAVCGACYAALTAASLSGHGRLHELDATADALRRRRPVVTDKAIKDHQAWYREYWTGFDAPTVIPSDDQEADDFVYFLTREDRTAIKFGHSVDPIDRRSDLQTGGPEELEILHVTSGGEPVEEEWKRRFAHLRTGAGEEWFRAEQELLDAIEHDRQGSGADAECRQGTARARQISA